MPAVALRREKKRSKPGLARASSAASFGGQAKDVASQGDANRAPSVSTLDIPQRIVRYEYRPDTAPTNRASRQCTQYIPIIEYSTMNKHL